VLFQVFSNIEPLHNEVTYQQAQLDRLPLLPSSSSPPWRAKDRVWYFGWRTNHETASRCFDYAQHDRLGETGGGKEIYRTDRVSPTEKPTFILSLKTIIQTGTTSVSASDTVIFSMMSDPKPTHFFSVTFTQSSIMNTHPHRPNTILQVFETQGGMMRIFDPKLIIF
jgi:hypothetical protein